MQKKQKEKIYEIPDWYRAATVPSFSALTEKKSTQIKRTINKRKAKVVCCSAK